MVIILGLDSLRSKIDKIDREIIVLVSERIKLGRKIGAYKKENNLPLHNPSREKQVLHNVKSLAKRKKLDMAFVEKIYRMMIAQTRKQESK